MGAFFTNVQVRVGNRGVGVTRDQVIEALRADAKARGLVEAQDGEDAASSAIVIADEGARWVTVYDENAEDQSSRIQELAGALSKAVDGWAVSVLVHDSDVLRLDLFQHGTSVDAYDSCPDYFDPKPGTSRGRFAGRAEKWTPVLANGVGAGALQTAWKGAKSVFVEESLRGLAPLFGFGEGVATGFNYYTEEQANPPNATRLRFRLQERAAGHGLVKGPPVFAYGGNGFANGVVGGTAQGSVDVYNEGGASRGFRVAVWGDALDRGLVSVDNFQIVMGPESEHRWFDVVAEARRYRDGAGEHAIYTADVDEPFAARPVADPNLPLARKLDARVSLHANIRLCALAAGQATLNTAIMPLANESGRAGGAMLVQIRNEGEPYDPRTLFEAMGIGLPAGKRTTKPAKKPTTKPTKPPTKTKTKKSPPKKSSPKTTKPRSKPKPTKKT